jgi:hypothetical protein
MRYVCLSLLLGLGAVPAGADDPPAKQPAPKLPLGKDTTFVTGPLDKEGYVDYEAALNATLRASITADRNANALLWQVFGPTPEGGDGMPPAFFKWLDIQPPPKEGDYFVGLGTFGRDRIGLTQEQMEALYEFQGRATQRPWEPKDCPPLAEWLKVNEKPLALAAEAVKRPSYFNPLVSRKDADGQGSLIGALLPSVQKCRELASAFSCRAMLRMKEGKYDDAWQDLLACHRLGRHVSHGATLIESLVGIAIGQIASNATLTYIERAKLTSKQAMERLKELRDLPPLTPMADKIDVGERIMGLDALQMIRRGGFNGLGLGLLGAEEKPSDEDLKALGMIDWTPTMRTMNKWYDRMAAAMREKDRAAREEQFDKLDEELERVAKKNLKPGDVAKLLGGKETGKVVGESIGNVLMGLLMPAVRKVQMAQDRAVQVQNNLQVAFAMAAYHADNGRYPANLDDLAPKYLPAVPGDIFSGKPLIYKPEAKGYLFYSVGQNGKDEGGHWYDDDPPGDDPRVKMPLPELKKK